MKENYDELQLNIDIAKIFLALDPVMEKVESLGTEKMPE